MFRCETDKCRVACNPACSDGSVLAHSFGYIADSKLAILGISIPLVHGSVPTLRKFKLQVARRRLRLISCASFSLQVQTVLIRTLVLPMATWAGGFARVDPEELAGLVTASRVALTNKTAVDTPAVLLHEVTAWSCHPEFALFWFALREAIRLQTCTPEWLTAASPGGVNRTWCDLLPVTIEVLQSLQWRVEDQGAFICRRDSANCVRRLEVGVDCEAVLQEWLLDVFRMAGLRTCARVASSPA